MKIAIYSRKSKFTGKGDSIGNQIDRCKDYINFIFMEEKNIEIKGSYLNLISGKMMERLNLMKPYDVYVLKKNK